MDPFADIHHYVEAGMTLVGGGFMWLIKRSITRIDEDIKSKASAEFVTSVDRKLDTFIQDSKEDRGRIEAKIDKLIGRSIGRRR